jgi:ABC-type dipeptide/oligopeptide/nickel transport system permease subunit
MSDSAVVPARSNRRRRLRRFLRDRVTVLGLVLFGALLILTGFAPGIAPFPYDRLAGPPLNPPGGEFLLGTDEIGRDLFSRILYAGRISLGVGLGATLVAAGVGLPLGLVSGYYGRADAAIMRAMDGLLAFPALLLALTAVAVLGPSLRNLIVAIGLVSVPIFARLVRASVLVFKQRDFVEATRAIGAGDARILTRTILPNCLPPLTVQCTLTFATAVLTEAGLSFLGLGVRPPTPSWGMMLNTGRNVMGLAPLYPVVAGAAVFVTVLSLNLIGDGLRDALDPHQFTRI